MARHARRGAAQSRRSGAAVVALIAAASCAVLAYLFTAPDRITDRAEARARLVPASTTPTASVAPSSAPPSSAKPSSAKPTRTVAAHSATLQASEGEPPTGVSLPDIGVTMKVIPVGVTADDDMEIPDDVQIAGWYRYGADVASDAGAVVLAAHVDSTQRGTGPLAALSRVPKGGTVRLKTESGEVKYVVESVNRYDKDAIDLDAVFDRSGPPRLHILTCGGAFDRKTRHYEDNVVLVAKPS